MSEKKKLGLTEEFLGTFGEVLSERGFKRVPKRATFHRATREGWYGIHAPITRYLDGVIVVALTAIIRFDAVERLVVKFTDDTLYVDGPNRGTLALFITDDVEQDRRAAFRIEHSGHLSEGVAWAKQRCTTQAETFFEMFPTLKDAYPRLLEFWPVNSLYDFPFGHERAKRVLAAAVTLKQYDNLGELVASLRAHLVQDPHALVGEFDDFARRVMSGGLC